MHQQQSKLVSPKNTIKVVLKETKRKERKKRNMNQLFYRELASMVGYNTIYYNIGFNTDIIFPAK